MTDASFFSFITDGFTSAFGVYAILIVLFAVFMLFSMVGTNSFHLFPLLVFGVVYVMIYTSAIAFAASALLGYILLILAALVTFALWRLLV